MICFDSVSKSRRPARAQIVLPLAQCKPVARLQPALGPEILGQFIFFPKTTNSRLAPKRLLHEFQNLALFAAQPRPEEPAEQ